MVFWQTLMRLVVGLLLFGQTFLLQFVASAPTRDFLYNVAGCCFMFNLGSGGRAARVGT